MGAFLTYAYDKFHNFFPHTGDGKSFTSLDGLRAHPNKSHLPKRPDCRDCCYKTNNAGHLKHHRDCWHNGTSQKVKKWRHKQWICTFHAHVYWQNECPHQERMIQPATPPKPKTPRVLDVVGEVTRWTNTCDGNNPDHFKCPFRKCERTYDTASECADHVHQEKHKSAWSTLIKKNTLSNSLPVFSRKLSWIVLSISLARVTRQKHKKQNTAGLPLLSTIIIKWL